MPNPLRSILFAAVLPLLAPTASAAAAPNAAVAAASSPVAVVHELTDSVMHAVRADPELRAGNPQKIAQMVETKILPFVDFREMTASAVGRFWRQASAQQKEQLQAQFKQLLIHTYAGAVKRVRDQQVRFLPLRADPGATSVVVRTRVIDQGDVIQIDYRMIKSDSGAWKISDVNVMGVWLVDNYRGVFAQEIGQKGIDGLIKTLEQRNQALAAGTGQ